MNKPITYFPAIAAVTIIAGAMAYWVVVNNNQKSAQNDKELLKRARTNYKSVINGINKSADLFYRQVVNQPEVLQIMEKAAIVYGDDRDAYRGQLYQKLLRHYEDLKEIGFRQLHFHLPNGTSFLRFHRPSKFGDNLKPFRYSVKRTNETLEPTSGFEEGRIFNGYRFVYPLLKGEKHIGSVEVSSSFLQVSQDLKNLEKSYSNVILKKSVTESKLFDDERKNYKVFDLQQSYVWDRNIIETTDGKVDFEFLRNLIAQAPDQALKAINKNFASLTNIKLEDKNFAFIVLPVPNIQGTHVASLLIAYSNCYATQLKEELKVRLAILIFLYLLIMFAFIVIIRRDRRILKTTRKLQKSQLDLAEADEVKAKLFEIITHDMRNHFSAVNGFSDLLNRKFYGNQPQMDKLLNGLKDSIHLTNSLMNNLFVWSRIQIGKIDYKPELFEATKWAGKLIDNYATIMERKQVKLVNETRGPVYIYGDKDMIAYIINNILHNAIKYSGKGSEIKVIITDDTKKSVIVVQDQGKGMTQQKVEQIMSKENWSGSKEANDIGLGLLITRRLINYHEGAINIESEAGVGTTVTVTIPKKLASSQKFGSLLNSIV